MITYVLFPQVIILKKDTTSKISFFLLCCFHIILLPLLLNILLTCNMVYIHSLSSLMLAGSVAKSSAFVSPHNLMIKPKCHGIVNPMSSLVLEEKKDGLDKLVSTWTHSYHLFHLPKI